MTCSDYYETNYFRGMIDVYKIYEFYKEPCDDKTEAIKIKPEYYIYSWKAGAFRSDELSKSLKGYSCRNTAERVARFRFDCMHDRIRYCVALTDEEAFVEMTRQNLPNAYFDTDNAEICYKCGRLFRARSGMFGSQFCTDCLLNTCDADNRKEESK